MIRIKPVEVTGYPEIDTHILKGIQTIAKRASIRKHRNDDGSWGYSIVLDHLTDDEMLGVDFVANGDQVFGNIQIEQNDEV
jgi:hypothetical protein